MIASLVCKHHVWRQLVAYELGFQNWERGFVLKIFFLYREGNIFFVADRPPICHQPYLEKTRVGATSGYSKLWLVPKYAHKLSYQQ